MKKPFHPKAIEALLVLFLGIAAWFGPGAVYGNDRFTIAVIPDTQFYVDSGNTLTTSPAYTQPSANDSAKYFQAETRWLADHKEALNLAFVTHVGDVVQNGDGTSNGTTPLQSIFPVTAEWDRALAAMRILADADIPFGMTPGNHDYDNYFHATNSRPLVSTNTWAKYFGPDSWLFKGKRWYGGASDSITKNNPNCPNNGLSSFQTFTAGGKKFLHISLELEAGTNVIAWAQGVINAYPGYATIVTTHSYISPFAAGNMSPPATQGGVNATYNAASFLVNSPCGWNGAANIFADLIYPNDQIFLVISGHSYNTTNKTGAYPGSSQGEGIRIDKNAAGHPVYQVLTDFQDNIVNHDGSALSTVTAPPYSHAPGAAGSVPYVPGISDPGGDGWIHLMTFDMTAGSIHFSTYSPLLVNGKNIPGTYAGQCAGFPCDCTKDVCDNTFEQPAAFSDFFWEMPMPVQVTNAASAWNPGPPGPRSHQVVIVRQLSKNKGRAQWALPSPR